MDTDSMLPNPPFFPIESHSHNGHYKVQQWNSFPLIRRVQNMPDKMRFRAYTELFMNLYQFLGRQANTTPTEDKTDEFQNAYDLHENMLSRTDNLSLELVRGPESLPMVIDLQ
jgi:hypothetical protein